MCQRVIQPLCRGAVSDPLSLCGIDDITARTLRGETQLLPPSVPRDEEKRGQGRANASRKMRRSFLCFSTND